MNLEFVSEIWEKIQLKTYIDLLLICVELLTLWITAVSPVMLWVDVVTIMD